MANTRTPNEIKHGFSLKMTRRNVQNKYKKEKSNQQLTNYPRQTNTAIITPFWTRRALLQAARKFQHSSKVFAVYHTCAIHGYEPSSP